MKFAVGRSFSSILLLGPTERGFGRRSEGYNCLYDVYGLVCNIHVQFVIFLPARHSIEAFAGYGHAAAAAVGQRRFFRVAFFESIGHVVQKRAAADARCRKGTIFKLDLVHRKAFDSNNQTGPNAIGMARRQSQLGAARFVLRD